MKVIIGIGVPGCGKTTHLKPLAQKLGLAYVNGDDIREELTGDPKDHTRETAVWNLARQRIKTELLNRGVVVDATHTKKKDRIDIIKFCKDNGAREITAYWFNTPLDTCLERNALRPRVVPEEAVKKMHNRLQLNPPDLEEGFTRILKIIE